MQNCNGQFKTVGSFANYFTELHPVAFCEHSSNTISPVALFRRMWAINDLLQAYNRKACVFKKFCF